MRDEAGGMRDEGYEVWGVGEAMRDLSDDCNCYKNSHYTVRIILSL
jgi:hypothetical protein